MDARELQKLWKELLESALSNKDVAQFMRNVGFVISYLISEQDKRVELTRAMSDLEKKIMITTQEFRDFKERSEKNTKMLRSILTAVLAGLAIELLRLAFGHKP